MAFRRSAAFALTGVLLLAGFAAPQAPKEKTHADHRAAPLPAEALRFGDALEQQASAAFLRWARAHAEKEMRSRPVNPRAAMQEVDRRYPGTSDAARDCGTFLLIHLAYKDEEARAQVLESEIRQFDRETYDLLRELQIHHENEQSRLGSVRGAIGAEQRVALQAKVDKMNERLREIREKRATRAREASASRKKIDLYLRVADVTHQRMKGIPTEAIRELQEPSAR